MYYYGARYYDPRAQVWASVDPILDKYLGNDPSKLPGIGGIFNSRNLGMYSYSHNNPVVMKDPDGNHVIVLGNSSGAKGFGHQAVLIGGTGNGWTYISKDGAEKSGGARGPSRYTVKTFKTVQEFANSMHNFETNENHSLVGGGENKEATFKLDENGNKVRRYDQAYFILTDPEYDKKAIAEATNEAQKPYDLTNSDCSDIPTAAFNILKSKEGKKLFNGEEPHWLPYWDERPNRKQNIIEEKNKGYDYDYWLKPDSSE